MNNPQNQNNATAQASTANNCYVVELEPGVWLAPWEGDPGRTLKKENAKRFDKVEKAMMALILCRTYRPFKNAKILST